MASRMLLKKIISGGQAGADIGGLRGANKRLLDTGGYAPKGFRSEDDRNIRQMKLFGLRQTKSSEYPPRTKKNVKSADATLWVGHDSSPGAKVTLAACRKHKKPIYKVPYDWPTTNRDFLGETKPHVYVQGVIDWLRQNKVKVLNVAGNRESTNTGISAFTESLVMLIISELRAPGSLERIQAETEKAAKRRMKKEQKRKLKREKSMKTKKGRKRLRRRLPDDI